MRSSCGAGRRDRVRFSATRNEQTTEQEVMWMKVAILTGGGDCPGPNAVIRAVVRRGEGYGFECVGAREGWLGLLNGDLMPLTRSEVDGILALGGTIIGT